ncbi:MAG: FeS assembly protein SufBD, partial [Promethearchaeota archaeon CR_4]
VEENGYFNTNYIVMSPVKTLQSNPQVYLNGANSKLYAQTLVYASKQANFDVGTVAYLNGPNSSAEIISRVVATEEAQILSRGDIHGRADGSKGHLSCDGLLLSNKAGIRAIPMLNGINPESRLSHEAAVGKIAQEQILYLMSRGLDLEGATAMILRGFLEAETRQLPPALAAETERLIKAAADSAM